VEVILDSNNIAYKPDSEALGVSNYVTNNELPATSQFGDTNPDPENFRLQARLPNATTNSVQMKFEVKRDGAVVSTTNYTLDKKDGDFVRGQFLRLVTDTEDDAVSGDQTILVKLGDKIKVSYDIAAGSKVEQEIQVGRPSSEDNNEADKPWKHDIRELKVNIVVMKNSGGTGPVVPKTTVDADIETTNERLAQSGIRLKVVSINMGQGNSGVAFPARQGASYSDGFDATLTLTVPALSPDEDALFGLKDGDKDSIDIFFADFSAATAAGFGQRGFAYQQIINLTGNIKGQNNILMSSNRTTLTMPHEIMHILLNANHRADPATALFKGGTTPSKAVGGTKRIGPYPDAAIIGRADTTTIRQSSETLP
jgi:hypothetical protein